MSETKKFEPFTIEVLEIRVATHTFDVTHHWAKEHRDSSEAAKQHILTRIEHVGFDRLSIHAKRNVVAQVLSIDGEEI